MTTTPTASPELRDLETLRKIGILITTQDNRSTDQPMFIVQQRRRMYGLDTGYCDNFIWLCSEDEYNEASAEEADALEAEYQDTGRAKDGWQRTGYIDQWEFVTACFTEQGCIDYLKLDGHNLKEPRIYAEGSYRNEEFRAVRNSLIALARHAQPEGEAPLVEGDAIARSKRILHLVDEYVEQQTAGRRTALRCALMDQFSRDITPHQLLEVARATGLRQFLHGVNATDARQLLAEFVAAVPAAACGVQQAAAPGALDADEMTRLRRLMRAIGWDHERDESDKIVRGTLFAVLGQAAGELERANSAPGTPEAPDEPVAWMNPHETFAPDAFLWQQDPGHPLYSVPVYKRAAQLDGGQGEGQ